MQSPTQVSRQTLLAQRIIEYLSQKNEPRPESEILKAISGRRKDKIEVIRTLRSDGLISFNGTGKKGDPFRYFVSAPSMPPLSDLTLAPSEESHNGLSRSSHEAPTVPAFKAYKLPNGNVLSLSREEFDEVVDLFRLMLRQDGSNPGRKSQIEKEIFEPALEEKQTCSNSKQIEEPQKF